MIKLNEIAAELQNTINANERNYDENGRQKYVFDIVTNTDDFNPGSDFAGLNGRDLPIINCCLMQNAADITPLRGLGDFDCGMRLVVVTDVTYQDEIYDILIASAQSISGSVGSNQGYAYSVAASTPETGEVEAFPDLMNDGINFVVYLRYLFISGGVLSDNVKVWLNGEILPFLSFGIGRVRNQNTANILGNRDLQTYIESQSLSFTLEMPYKSDEVNGSLAQSMLVGALDTIYQLKYTDGVALNPEHTDSAGNPSRYFYFYVTATENGNGMQPHRIASQSVAFTLARTDAYAEQIAALRARYPENYDAEAEE